MDARLRRLEEQLTRVRQLCESGELWAAKVRSLRSDRLLLSYRRD
jgi:hypothetical protein